MENEKLIEEIEIEIERIEMLFENYKPLLRKVKTKEPNFIETASLAMLLHSFYNGIENIFIRIAKEIDQKLPQGSGWHKELLNQMTEKTPIRKQVVLSEEMVRELEEYLGFRHFSRHAYAFDLNWKLMKELVLRLSQIKEKVCGEIKLFILNFKKVS